MIDYEILRLIWWALLGILLIGFAIMDGFDLGTAALLPFVARNDIERRVTSIRWGRCGKATRCGSSSAAARSSPHGRHCMRRAFPAFIWRCFWFWLRSFCGQSDLSIAAKWSSPHWRSFWDYSLFAGGIVPALVFGVAFGNLFEGVPFGFDSDLRMNSTITLLSLLNPFALLVGLVSLSMIILHGAVWLNLKTDGVVKTRARATIPYAAVIFAILFTLAGLWLSLLEGFQVAGQIAHDGPSNPLNKTVILVPGGWYANFISHPALWIIVAVAYLGAIGAVLLRARPGLAFISSALVPLGTIATAGVALFPFLMPSSSNPNESLTVWDASSSQLTLAIMLGAVVIFLPVILAYTAWVYHVMRGPVRAADITRNSKTAY